jgi:MSHA biogenesis protein MshK
MAKHLSKANKKGTIGLSFLIGMMATVANAQTTSGLVDPTRPPSSISATPDAANDAPASAGLVLQSVRVSPTRVVAIINGQSVRVGEMVGEAKVIKISDGEVVLRTGKELQVLKLFPNVEKHLSPSRGSLSIESRRP